MDPNKIAAKFSCRSTFSHTFSNISKNLRIFIIMSCVLILMSLILAQLLYFIVAIILGPIIGGIVTNAISHTNEDKPSSLKEAATLTAPRILHLVVISIIFSLAFVALLLLPALPVLMAPPGANLQVYGSLGPVILWVVAIAALVFLSTTFMATLPVCAIEKTNIIQSMRRSAELTKGNRIKIFVLLIPTSIIAYIINVLIKLALYHELMGVIVIFLIIQNIVTIFITFLLATTYFELKAVKGDTISAEDENEPQSPQ